MPTQPLGTNGSAPKPKRELLTMLARNRTTFLSFVGAFALLFFGLSLMAPQTFESVTTALPPERSAGSGMLSMLSSSIAADFLKGSENPTLDLFKTIVESRNIAEEVAKDPKIRAFLGHSDTSWNGMVGTLQGVVQGEALRTGMFTVTVDLKTHWSPSDREIDSTRQMAAYISNAFTRELDRFNRDRLMTTARNTRIFIEKEYNERMAQLDSEYRMLQHFQESNQAISLPDQLGATVSAAAKLTSQIQELEMQIGIEQQDLSPNSTHMQALQSELNAAREQLKKYDDGGAGEYVLALKDVPSLSRELAGYMRETKMLEQLTAYLRQELEQQRISEQRDLPSLQVLDSARVPKQRSAPHRSIMLIIGLVVGTLVGTGAIAWREYLASVRQSPLEHYRFVNFMTAVRRGKKAKLYGPYAPQPASTGNAEAEKLLVTRKQEA